MEINDLAIRYFLMIKWEVFTLFIPITTRAAGSVGHAFVRSMGCGTVKIPAFLVTTSMVLDSSTVLTDAKRFTTVSKCSKQVVSSHHQVVL